MTLYFLYTVQQHEVLDRHAIDLPNLTAVRKLAVRYAGDLLVETSDGLFETDLQVQVSNEDSLLLFAIDIFATESPAIKRR